MERMKPGGLARVSAVACACAFAGCAPDGALWLDPPPFGPEVETIFYAVGSPSGPLQVFAAGVDGAPVELVLESSAPAGSRIFAIADPSSPAEHGLELGPVPPAPLGEGRPFTPTAVLAAELEGPERGWTEASLPEWLAEFRFRSRVALSRCAELRKVAEYSYASLVSVGTRIPTLLAYDESRVLAIPANESRAALLSATGSQAVDLGLVSRPRTARAVYLSPAKEIFVGGYAGQLYRGTIETGLRPDVVAELDPLQETAPRDHEASLRALDGSRDATAPLEVYAAAYAGFVRLIPGVERFYQRTIEGNGRQVGQLAWLSPGRVLFALEDERVIFELRNGEVRVAFAGFDVGGLAFVPGLGAVAITWDGGLFQFDEATGEFARIARNLTSRVTSIAGDGERMFVLSEDGHLDQYVPGEPLCPRIAQRPLTFARLVVFGRNLAKTGDEGIELFEIVAPP